MQADTEAVQALALELEERDLDDEILPTDSPLEDERNDATRTDLG